MIAAPLMFGSSRGRPNSLRAGFTGDGHIVAETLRGHPRPGSNSNGQVVAFHPTDGGEKGLSVTEDGTTPGTGTGAGGTVAIAFSENQRGELLETDIAHQLTAGGGKPGQGYSAVRAGASVRRLTPTECERLQALPDGWTQLGGTPDSRRYAALGDAVTASVGEWLGRRLEGAA